VQTNAHTFARIQENVQENVQTNAHTFARIQENVQENVQALARFTGSTHAGARGLVSSLSQEEVFREIPGGEARSLNGHGNPQGARAREVDAYEPSREVVETLEARGLRQDQLPGALERYRELRLRTDDTVSDNNFRAFVVERYMPRSLGVQPLPDMRRQTVSARTAEGFATMMHWQPPERRGRNG
jgi:hypothetical protein